MLEIDWEISYIESMPEEAQKNHYDKLLEKYKEKLKDLRFEELENNAAGIAACAWRSGIIAAGLALFSGAAMYAYGQGPVSTVGGIASISSIPLFGLGVTGSVISDDDGPKEKFVAAKEARQQIKELKAKIKNVEKKKSTSVR